MRVVGIDPAPKKKATLYEREAGWYSLDTHELPSLLKQRLGDEPLLICWDAPLTVGSFGPGCFYGRQIETFFRNDQEFTTPEGISVRPPTCIAPHQ